MLVSSKRIYDFIMDYYDGEFDRINDPEEIKTALYDKFYEEYERMCATIKHGGGCYFLREALDTYIEDANWDEITEKFIEESKNQRSKTH
jgi:hypothetical protein